MTLRVCVPRHVNDAVHTVNPSCFRAATPRRRQAEDRAASFAHTAGPTLGSHGLALRGIVARIAGVHGETREEIQPSPQASE